MLLSRVFLLDIRQRFEHLPFSRINRLLERQARRRCVRWCENEKRIHNNLKLNSYEICQGSLKWTTFFCILCCYIIHKSTPVVIKDTERQEKQDSIVYRDNYVVDTVIEKHIPKSYWWFMGVSIFAIFTLLYKAIMRIKKMIGNKAIGTT